MEAPAQRGSKKSKKPWLIGLLVILLLPLIGLELISPGFILPSSPKKGFRNLIKDPIPASVKDISMSTHGFYQAYSATLTFEISAQDFAEIISNMKFEKNNNPERDQFMNSFAEGSIFHETSKYPGRDCEYYSTHPDHGGGNMVCLKVNKAHTKVTYFFFH